MVKPLVSPLAVRKIIGGTYVVADETVTPGNIFFVNSVTGVDTAGHGTSPDDPFATLAFAISQCTAAKHDRIYLMPGHAESLSAAAAIACTISGVDIIGVGHGGLRPTFTWTTTDATWTVSGANVRIRNIRCTCSADEVVSMFAVSAANVTFDAVDYVETATKQALQFMLTTAAADYLTIKNCRHYQITAAATAQVWIQLVGVDHPRIVDNTFLFVAFASTSSVLISMSTACVYVEIARNNIMWIGATITIVISSVTGSTGMVCNNNIASGTSVATAAVITMDTGFMFDNKWADTAQVSGLLAPVVDTDT